MELYNIYSHKMAINTHYIQERTTVLYSQSKEKLKKKKFVRSPFTYDKTFPSSKDKVTSAVLNVDPLNQVSQH